MTPQLRCLPALQRGKVNLAIQAIEKHSGDHHRWMIHPNTNTLWILELEGTMVGALAEEIRTQEQEALHVTTHLIWVHPHYRNQGLARQLMEASLDHWKKLFCEREEQGRPAHSVELYGDSASEGGEYWIQERARQLQELLDTAPIHTHFGTLEAEEELGDEEPGVRRFRESRSF